MKAVQYLAALILGLSPGISRAAAQDGKPAFRFDFGPGEAASGFTRIVASTAYSDERGYGFDFGSAVNCLDRGGSSPLESDLCTSDRSFFFSVKVPEGNYRVTATFGDKKTASVTTVKADQFRLEGPLPMRVDLKTGQARRLDRATFKGQGRVVPGGAATVLHLPLDPSRVVRSLTVRALANDVVIGLMAASLVR